MDYIRQYKSFVNSYNWSSAVRITAGIVLPSVLLAYFFNSLSAGIVVSIGAMCVGNMDIPGPIHHRRNGMIACVLIIFFVTLLTGIASSSHLLTGTLVFVCCFVFSLIGIYGNRASSIGVNAMLVMVLNIDRSHQGWDILINAAYVFAGGAWYTILSLLLYSFRPYKLTQQALGDCIQATAAYLRIKASFYDKEVDYDKSYRLLVDEQVDSHEKQELVRELLFKSRDIVKESTHMGRVLVMIFLDIVDLFERVMTSQQDYRMLHKYFDGSGSPLLEECRRLILDLASELDGIGIAIKSGDSSVSDSNLAARIREIRVSFNNFRDGHRTADNVEAFIGLSHILDSIQDIEDRLATLHGYTTYDLKLAGKFNADLDYEEFVTHQDISGKLLLENLTLKSNIFRHSLRVSIATLAGYIVAGFLPFGHGYWILLTVIVILKPAYSLTRQRNYQRLMGTLAGVLAGLVILYFIKDRALLFAVMIIFMMGTYVFLRTNYLVAVALTTPYVLLLFHLLYPTNFRTVITDRVIDTVIGSALAFLANIFIIPSWEHERITDYMVKVIRANADYFTDVAGVFTTRPGTLQRYKLSRKNAFVALANLSDAFDRMLSEPRSKRRPVGPMHQFVVSNHMLTSHIATLAYYLVPATGAAGAPNAMAYADPAYQPLVEAISRRLENSVDILENGFTNAPEGAPASTAPSQKGLRILNEKVNALMDQRKAELATSVTAYTPARKQLSELKPVADQFNFIAKISADIERLSRSIRVERDELRMDRDQL
ncbi:MAG TPA: FUSC family membrane protein [Puia sp.]|nr:FUSC family membrane protein [Puia sp.]